MNFRNQRNPAAERTRRWPGVVAVVCLGLWGGLARPAAAQSSSVYGDPQSRRPLTLADTSWTYEMPAEAKQFRVHDQLTVMVKENAVVSSQGQMDRRKTVTLDTILSSWVLLSGFSLIPDPHSQGKPEVNGSYQNTMQSKADLETKDKMTFNIAVTVVDKRPNGYLVVEGRRTITNNNEVWEQCLTGVIRPEDVMPNNTTTSDKVAELHIVKREAGHVRDGYRRGWMLKFLDQYQAF